MIEGLVIQEDGLCGDTIEAALFEDGGICLTVENPWSGDTEHGFGASGSVTLTKEQACKLAAWLLKAAQ